MQMRIRDLGIFLTLDPGWKKFGSGVRDNHPGSATLLLTSSFCALPKCPHYFLYLTF
jgi:hypothetical protein